MKKALSTYHLHTQTYNPRTLLIIDAYPNNTEGSTGWAIGGEFSDDSRPTTPIFQETATQQILPDQSSKKNPKFVRVCSAAENITRAIPPGVSFTLNEVFRFSNSRGSLAENGNAFFNPSKESTPYSSNDNLSDMEEMIPKNIFSDPIPIPQQNHTIDKKFRL